MREYPTSALAEITSVLGDTRQLTLVSRGLLNADVAGAVVAESALLGHWHTVAWSASALLVPVVLSWITAALFLVLAERPVAAALGELCHAARVPPVCAVTVQHARARRAQCWAIIATAGFLLWMVFSLAIA